MFVKIYSRELLVNNLINENEMNPYEIQRFFFKNQHEKKLPEFYDSRKIFSNKFTIFYFQK